jgi:putative transposase
MTNHYHLLVETPSGNISRFMQQLNTSYTMYYNVKHERVGHVFSGRYKAKVVCGDEYLLALTRYLHLNPVKVGGMKGRCAAEKVSFLRGYGWSSYRGYAGLSKAEKWVDHAPLSELAGQYAAERREGDRLLVESGLAEDDDELKEALNRSSKAVGGWKFCRQVEKLYRKQVQAQKSGSDVAMRRMEVGDDPDEVMKRVGQAFAMPVESFSRRRSVADARLAAARLLKDLTSLTAREIGRRLGLADGSGLGNLLRLADERLAGSRKLRRLCKALKGKEQS